MVRIGSFPIRELDRNLWPFTFFIDPLKFFYLLDILNSTINLKKIQIANFPLESFQVRQTMRLV